MRMNATKSDRDSDSDDTLTSNACTDSSAEEESDHGEISDSESISLSVVSTTSTVTSKKNPNKKRVSFKPGDSLVLVYEIPNRAMLGLKSDSESSDDDEDDDSDDEDDDSDSDEDSGEDQEDEEEENENEHKNKRKDSKCIPKLLSVNKVTRRNNVECKTEIKRNSRKVAQLIGLSINPTQQSTPKKRTRKFHRMRLERDDNNKFAKKEPHPKAIVVDEVKRKKVSTRMSKGLNAISNQSLHGRSGRGHKNRRFLEIKATLQTSSRGAPTSVPCVTKYKQDLKPSIATLDSQGAISVCGKQISQKLTHRARLQPTSFRLAKTRLTTDDVNKPVMSTVASLEREKYPPNVKQAMSATYECLQSLKRLDPENMNAKNKRNYAWQVANGTISSHQLRTPSILPFWDSLQNAVIDNNVIKFPT